jgi:hypothetical protein
VALLFEVASLDFQLVTTDVDLDHVWVPYVHAPSAARVALYMPGRSRVTLSAPRRTDGLVRTGSSTVSSGPSSPVRPTVAPSAPANDAVAAAVRVREAQWADERAAMQVRSLAHRAWALLPLPVRPLDCAGVYRSRRNWTRCVRGYRPLRSATRRPSTRGPRCDASLPTGLPTATRAVVCVCPAAVPVCGAAPACCAQTSLGVGCV